MRNWADLDSGARWWELRESLVGPSGVLRQANNEWNDKVEFSASFFSGGSSSDTCSSYWSKDYDLGFSVDAMYEDMASSDTMPAKVSGQAGTPTRYAMQEASNWLSGVGTTQPTFIVMATDGRPSTCGAQDSAVLEKIQKVHDEDKHTTLVLGACSA